MAVNPDKSRTPISVRLPPEALEALRALAAGRGSSVHGEIVQAVADHLADAGEDPVTRALKTVIAALANQFVWIGSTSEEEHRTLRLRLFRSAVVELLDELDVGDADGENARWEAKKLLAQLKTGPEGPLAEAARVLGIRQELSS